MSLIFVPLLLLTMLGIFFAIYKASFNSGKREATERERREMGVGTDFDDVLLPGSTALGYVAGQLSSSPHAARLVAPLSVATINHAMACAQMASKILQGFDNSRQSAYLLHGRHFARLIDGSRSRILILDEKTPFIWNYDANVGIGTFFFVGPLGPSARFEVNRDSGLHCHGPAVFQRFVTECLRPCIDIDHLFPEILDDEFFCGKVTRPGPPTHLRPWLDAADLAHKAGLVEAGPLLFDASGQPVMPEQHIKQHYAKAWRVAKGLEEPRITLQPTITTVPPPLPPP